MVVRQMGQQVLHTLTLQMGNYDYGKKQQPLALLEPEIMKSESLRGGKSHILGVKYISRK